MLEEIIDASPSSLNQSLRQKREHRKTKSRRLIELTSNASAALAAPSLHEENAEMVASQLFSTFWHSENDENVQDSTYPDQKDIFQTLNNFELFKEENMLAVADQSACPIIRRSQKPTKMFQTCERLLETQQNLNETEYLSCEGEADDSFNVQTEWVLEPFENKEETQQNHDETLKPTPTTTCNGNNEVAYFDDVLETTFLDIGTSTQQAPLVQQTKNTKFVDKILEDFCASLSSSSDDESKSVNFEPYFRFRKKKIRTYERCFRRRGVTKNAVASPRGMDDIELSDTSSELSVQETRTQLIPAVEPLSLDLNGAVHNNLLNLSAFFTQNLLESYGNVVKEEALSPASPIVDESDRATNMIYDAPYNLLSEIHTLRLKYENFSIPILCTNSNDLLGFASTAEYEKRFAQTEAVHFQSSVQDVPQVLNNVKAVEAATAQKIIAATQPQTATTVPDRRSMDSIIAPVRSCDSEPAIFSEETWQDDSEFFLNFKTQAIVKVPKSKSQTSLKTCAQSDFILDGTTSKNQSQEEIVERERQTDMVGSQIDVDDVIKLFEQPTSEFKSNTTLQQCDEKVVKCDFEEMVLSEWQLEKYEETNDEIIEEKKEQAIAAGHNNFKNNADAIAKNNDDLLDLFEKNEFWIEPFTQFIKQGNCINTHCEPSTSKQAAELVTNQQRSFVLENNPTSNSTENQAFNKTPIHQPFETSESINNLKTETTEKGKFLGFQTAACKPINISEKARKKYQNFFDEIIKEDCNADHQSTAKKVTIEHEPKQANNELSEQLPGGNLLKPHQPRLIENPAATAKSKFSGFQTASCKPISISEKAQKKYQNFFDEILKEEDCNVEQQSTEKKVTIEHEPEQVNKQLKERLAGGRLLKEQQPTLITNPAAISKSKFVGFQTASCKPISISEKAQKKYQNFFDELLQEDECNVPPQPTKKIEANKQKTPNENCVDDFSDIQLSEWLPGDNSPKQQQQTPKTKSKISPKKEWPIKRKFRSLENTDSTATEQPTKKLYKSYTMDNISEQTLKNENLRSSISHMPTTSRRAAIESAGTEQTPSLIVRKNLLSLTKRRKSKLKQSLNNNNDNEVNNVETPVKLMAASKLSANLATTALYTPNASEFYANLPDAASTPQVQLETPSRRLHALRSADNLDSDFKRINWEQFDDCKSTLTSPISAITPTRAINSSLNGTMKPLPSPQERIENLSGCGDPPPLPQIVTSNVSRCRSLGLSRRSRKN